MLTIEDESEILKSEYPMIVPVLIDEYNGDYEIEAYHGVEKTAEEFHSLFWGHFFSEKAIDWLDLHLRDYVESLGYLRECTGKYRWYDRYEANDAESLNSDLILPSTSLLCEGEYEFLVSFSLAEQLSKGLQSFVTLIGNKIVSIATVNEHDNEQKMLEITVETAPEYRNNGYGLSNTVALAGYLIENGYTVAYACSRYNRASQSIAKKAGFRKNGRFYAYTAYKL